MSFVTSGSAGADRRSGDHGAGILAIAVAIALLAGCASPAPSPSGGPGPSGAPAAPPAPTASAPTPSPSPAGPPPDDAWDDVVLPDQPVPATLVPVRGGAGGIATTTAFRLTSLDGTPVEELAGRLAIEPSASLKVVRVDGATAVVRPTAPLAVRTAYRISLTREDGTVAATWAAQTAGPLHVVETIPGDEATRVPRNTGIELHFDQAGVTTGDLEEHLRIEPAVEGRLEAAGRVIAFVPDRPLRKATLYTVTVRRGLPIHGTDQVLEQDVVIRFETTSGKGATVQVAFRRVFVEATPRDPADIGLWVDARRRSEIPTGLALTVHRLPGLAAAERAWAQVFQAPTWTRRSTVPAVPTAGLPTVVDTRVAIQDRKRSPWIRLPRTLPAGWYLATVTVQGIPRQAVLQVTDLATYTMVTTTRTMVWVNDLATTGPVRGAQVSLGGRRLGATDGDGLVTARTPRILRAVNAVDLADDPMASDQLPELQVVRAAGRVAFQPIEAAHACYWCQDDTGGNDWWRLLSSDRYEYRSTDTVNAWGVVRRRDTGAVPRVVEVRLQRTDRGDLSPLPISALTSRPDARGAFAVSVPLESLPIGYYRLVFLADGQSIGEMWLRVATISKPAYQLAVTTDHRALISGETVVASVHAAFFEETPVAGTELRLSCEDGDGQARTTTDATGDATVAMPIRGGDGSWTVTTIEVVPAQPEEADIHAGTRVAVFAGSALVDVTGRVAGGRLTVEGKVSDVVLERFEAADAGELGRIDPRGAGRPDAAVEVTVTERWTIRKQTGTRYDFITKRVRPVYDTRSRSRTVASRTVTTGPDGTFSFRLPVTGGDREYSIAATYVDEAGRLIRDRAWVEATIPFAWDDYPRLVGGRGRDENRYSVGDTVTVRYVGGMTRPRASRYLFAVLQDGLQSRAVQAGATFRTRFRASSVPAISILAVRFTGYGYEETYRFQAALRLADRRLAVTVTPDHDGYAPGEVARIQVSTTFNGNPVAASVFVQAVDQKLYATGGAGSSDPMSALYEPVDDGLVTGVASHWAPSDEGRGGKDTTGGGEGGDARSDFRDWLIGRLVHTDRSGTATVEIPLSDDLTSWHVTAAAIDGQLRAGAGSVLLPVSLPFFVEATVAAEYLVADRPIIRVRAFGADLSPGSSVVFTISSTSLSMAPVTVTAPAFEAAEVPLPALAPGVHALRIEGTSGDGAAVRRDVLERTFRVVTSRTSQQETTWQPLDAPATLPGGGGITRLLLADAGRGRVLPVLEELAWARYTRADTRLAADLATTVLQDNFGIRAEEPVDPAALDPYRADEGLLAQVPYGSADLEVSVLAALAGDPRLDANAAMAAFRDVVDHRFEQRDRRLLALAGMAGLGAPVLGDIRAAAAQTDLTVAEQVTLALAALAAGDEELARTLEHQVLATHGRHLGPWTRIDPGIDADAAVQTARLAIVAASLGEPVAAELDRWVADNPSRTTTVALERVLAARGWARRVAGSAVSAVLTVDGATRDVSIRAGSSVSFELTPAQAATAVLRPGTGQVLVVTTHQVPLDGASLTAPTGQLLERRVSPSDRIRETDTVRVTLRVTLGPWARDECWRLVDTVPSGLAPIAPGGRRYDDDDEGDRSRFIGQPDSVDGQRVEGCLRRDPERPVQELTYVARVVNPGTYVWEPALLQSSVAPEQGLVTPPGTIVITGAGG